MVINNLGSKPSSFSRFAAARTPTVPSLFSATGWSMSAMTSWRIWRTASKPAEVAASSTADWSTSGSAGA